MGGNSSKDSNYTMITDHKLTKAHYQKVESNTPSKLMNKGSSMSAMTVSPEVSLGAQQNQKETTPPRLKKGRSVSAITPSPPDYSKGQLKKGISERGTSLADRRKSSPVVKKDNQLMSFSLAKGGSSSSKSIMSARLPWLVKDTSIASCM
jgi:hypothetical protein